MFQKALLVNNSVNSSTYQAVRDAFYVVKGNTELYSNSKLNPQSNAEATTILVTATDEGRIRDIPLVYLTDFFTFNPQIKLFEE